MWDDSYSNVSEFEESVKSLDLDAVIFHDGIKEAKEKSDELKWMYSGPISRPPAIERFYILKHFLENNDVDRVFLTDLFDLWFNKNPFNFMDERDEEIFVGGQEMTIFDDRWLLPRLAMFAEHANVSYGSIIDNTSLQAGILGAKKGVMLNLVKEMIDLFDQLPNKNSRLLGTMDMAVVNYLLWTEYEEDLFWGFPLNSETRSYQEEGEFYVKHK